VSGEVDEDGEGNWDVVEVLEMKDCMKCCWICAIDNGDGHCGCCH